MEEKEKERKRERERGGEIKEREGVRKEVY